MREREIIRENEIMRERTREREWERERDRENERENEIERMRARTRSREWENERERDRENERDKERGEELIRTLMSWSMATWRVPPASDQTPPPCLKFRVKPGQRSEVVCGVRFHIHRGHGSQRFTTAMNFKSTSTLFENNCVRTKTTV